MTEVAKVLKIARAKSGLSLAKLGKHCDVSPQYFTRIERGFIPMSVPVMKKCALALRVPEKRFLSAALKDYKEKLHALGLASG